MNSAIYLIVLPLLLGFTSILLKDKKFLLLGGALINAVLAVVSSKGEILVGGFKPPYGINLVVDSYSYFGIVMINVLFLLAVLVASEQLKKYESILLVALAGLNGMMLTGDLFNLFVFLEITAISAYVLTARAEKYEYSLNYIAIGTIGSGLYLFGLIMLYSTYGSLNMADLAGKVDTVKMLVPLLMIFAGFAVETKLFPFNGWVKGVYGNADFLVGPLLASVYAGTMLLVFGRIFAFTFAPSGYLLAVILTIGVITVILGEAAAFSRSRLREILLFSSIGQSGVITILFASGLVLPALMQTFNNVVNKFVLFAIAGKIKSDAGTDEADELSGIFLKNKCAGIIFTISTLSVIGLPLFFGFFSKLNLLLGLFSTDNFVAPAAILIATIIEGAYFIRLLVRLWTPGEEGEESSAKFATKHNLVLDMKFRLITALLALTVLIGGILPAFTSYVFEKDGYLADEDTSYVLDLEGGNN